MRAGSHRLTCLPVDCLTTWRHTALGRSHACSTHIIQQSTRLQRTLYLLYIDLATFFPRIDRKVMIVAEAVHRAWAAKGGRRAVADDLRQRRRPSGAVECHYDSAAGLGRGFKSWMGALMGCVLSPDKAKMLLNSVVVAINAVCKGVKLWGYGGRRAWRRRGGA